MQQQMESRDEETLELKETYSSLQQEVDIKTKKLKKVKASTLGRWRPPLHLTLKAFFVIGLQSDCTWPHIYIFTRGIIGMLSTLRSDCYAIALFPTLYNVTFSFSSVRQFFTTMFLHKAPPSNANWPVIMWYLQVLPRVPARDAWYYWYVVGIGRYWL